MILGTQYYRPPFPERRFWRKDLDRIKSSGLNSIQLWVLWSWVEPEHGVFIFQDYDALFDEAEKRRLEVILSTIAELQPYWIHRMIPDSYMVDHMGRRVISSNRAECNQGLTPGGCTDHPEVKERIKIFLEKVAGRYASRENLRGWDCWNELRWNVQSDGLVCFCPYTLESFRNWLKKKYGSLEGLNEAWKRRYSSFEDVLPGKLPGRTYTEMMEFEAFLQWRATDHIRFRTDTIRGVDKDHIITAHGAKPSILSPGDLQNHALNRGNDWDLAEHLDGLGCSHFPFWFDIDDQEYGMRVEATRSAAGKKILWVSELQGGSARQGFNTYPSVDAKTQQRWVWNSYGRGAKAVIFWCWRDEVFGKESSGYGISGRDGYAEERLEAVKETGRIINRYRDLLEGYRPDPPKVAVLFEPHTYNLEWAQDGTATRSSNSIVGYLTALERIQVPYQVAESSHLQALHKLKMLIMPWPLVVPEYTAEKVGEFVDKGGMLLIEGEADAYTPQGFYKYPSEERLFNSRLGIEYLGRRMLSSEELLLEFKGRPYELKTSLFITPFKVDEREETEVLSIDGGRQTLAVRKKAGEGEVIALGTFLGERYRREKYEEFELLLRSITQEARGIPELEVSSREPLQWRSGLSGYTRLLFITNPGKKQKARIRAPIQAFQSADAVTELRSGKNVPLRKNERGGTFEIGVEEGGYAILGWKQE